MGYYKKNKRHERHVFKDEGPCEDTKETAICKPRREDLEETTCPHLDLGLPASRNVRK